MMEGFFPAQTLSLFLVFESCFTAPSFAYFRGYVWALMVVEGRKCLTRLARCAFFHQRDDIYRARCSIKLTIRDWKQHCDLGDYQCTTMLAILPFVHLACLALCLWRLVFLEHMEAGWLHVTS